METTEKEESISSLQRKLKEKIRELDEAQRNNTKLSNEITKLTRYNKDLIGQIDLTNSKLHVLLGVCEGRADKSIQTDFPIDELRRCTQCQSVTSEAELSQKSNGKNIFNQEDTKQMKAADWAKIAQEVVDSNDYIYEPTSKTYYSQSSGWYYYPNEKLFFDPKSKNYYTFNHETKSYEIYSVETTEQSSEPKKNKKIKIEQESEEGELSSSASESSHLRDNQSDSEDDYDDKKVSKFERDELDNYNSDDESNISCLRLIVRESESLKLGSLLLITITGALIGNSPDCDLIITDPSVSRKHARISYNQKRRCYQIADSSSKHGVFLNGEKLEGDEIRVIKHGDILKLAKSEFLLHHHYGKEVTCNGCEPGCVQADLLESGRLVKEEDDPIIVEDRHTALKKLKKRYGVSWDEENRLALPQNYKDRAKKRRIEKGSDNPYEKTGEGTSLDKPLTQENKGFKMLEKLGWSKGKGVGKTLSGETKPLPLVSTEGRSGLGFHS